MFGLWKSLTVKGGIKRPMIGHRENVVPRSWQNSHYRVSSPPNQWLFPWEKTFHLFLSLNLKYYKCKNVYQMIKFLCNSKRSRIIHRKCFCKWICRICLNCKYAKSGLLDEEQCEFLRVQCIIVLGNKNLHIYVFGGLFDSIRQNFKGTYHLTQLFHF